MNIKDRIGISYRAGYLVQGNQLERCKTSTNLKANYTELQIRTDGKDSDISSIIKSYEGNVIFRVPAINPDLSNLKLVNDLVKKVKDNDVKLISINATNLSSDLFEWSTLDEQKKYFLNIVTSIATLASNKIEVAIENLKSSDVDSMFGSNITQITDIIVYSRRLLIKDFGFKEEEAEKYIGVSLNIDNIDLSDESESILNYFEVFNKSIKLVKISDLEKLDVVLDHIVDNNYNIPILLQTSSELEEVKNEYLKLVSIVSKRCSESVSIFEINNTNENKGVSNIIIITMIILTIVIVGLMFFIKLKI